MNKPVFILSGLILICTISCARRSISLVPSAPPPPPSPYDTLEYREFKEKQKCTFFYRLDADQRRKIFPFSNSSIVEIVSFSPVVEKYDDSTYAISGGLPMKRKEIDFNMLNERLVLTENQIDTLTNILYNFNSTSRYPLVDNLASYCPSMNAILFFDKRNNCFAYIDLCFEGPDFHLYPSNIDVGEFCIGKFDLLKGFFRSIGIKEGLDSVQYEN